ncbi:MAG: dTDP-4-dehydrorhamnose 3,5-epimerase, partial [Mucinivorans sp.]
ITTDIEGLCVIENFSADDIRGTFVKDFQADEFASAGLEVDFREIYYSSSKKGVVRGMHFQTPPSDHTKLVHVIQGSILDVVVDLRHGSPTVGQYRTFELNDQNHLSLYVSRGLAHGFLALSDQTIVSYKVTTTYNPACDKGLRYNSFGFEWPATGEIIISERDKNFPSLEQILEDRYF